MVPPFVPLEPELICNQLPPEVTLAVQFIVPVPVFDTLNEVLPDEDVTSRCEGVTESTGWDLARRNPITPLELDGAMLWRYADRQ